MKKDIPGLLWIAIVALGVISVLGLLAGLTHGFLVALVAAGCNLILMFGLLRGYAWAYLLTVVLSVLGIAVALGRGGSQGVTVLAGNSVVLVPVILCTGFFFSRRSQRVQ